MNLKIIDTKQDINWNQLDHSINKSSRKSRNTNYINPMDCFGSSATSSCDSGLGDGSSNLSQSSYTVLEKKIEYVI